MSPYPVPNVVAHLGRKVGASVAAGVMAALTLTGVAGPSAHAASSQLNIVAIGDSYASGEGAKGPGWSDSNPHRSALAAPQEAAQQITTSFTSVACSGSVIEDGPDGAHQLLNSGSGAGTVFGQLSRVGSPG